MTMRHLLVLFLLAGALGAALVGCGPDDEILEVPMILYDSKVEEIGRDFAVLSWRTSLDGDTRVDLALVAQAATGEENLLETVSDELYLPRMDGGGVTIPDPRFESVSNTRYTPYPLTRFHRQRVDLLLPGRTYVGTVSSLNGLGAGAREFGARLTFTTLP